MLGLSEVLGYINTAEIAVLDAMEHAMNKRRAELSTSAAVMGIGTGTHVVITPPRGRNKKWDGVEGVVVRVTKTPSKVEVETAQGNVIAEIKYLRTKVVSSGDQSQQGGGHVDG